MAITNAELRQMALDEYNSDVTTAHHGFNAGGLFWSGNTPNHNGVKSRPFWNVYATQFIFNPCFEFTPMPCCTRYLFTATDCNRNVHTFEAETPMALLTPIWGDLPEGYVHLTVEALDDDGTPWAVVGARTFWRGAPFTPGSYPEKVRSYRECALMAYRYIYHMPAVQHWLVHGVPDPAYDLNVYPTKMISAIIQAMIFYASLDPENAENALRLAKNAADYLLSISVKAPSPLAGLPPTYSTKFRSNSVEDGSQESTMMMFYPASAGSAYLALEEATGETKYFEAAQKIADYYRQNVLDNGTWHLVLSIADGKNLSVSDCNPDAIIVFLKMMYERTGEDIWKELIHNAHKYRAGSRMDSYNWEGQFEDSPTSAHYSNLAHSPADTMIQYIAENQKDDPEAMAQAEDLMRFVEDQFVVWGKHAPKNRWINRYWLSENREDWASPAGLEQYNWYVPIDSSTAGVMYTFLSLYQANGNPLLLAKACALADSITRMQNPETGMIPTHWTRTTCSEDGGDFWINCHISTANLMLKIAKAVEKIQ